MGLLFALSVRCETTFGLNAGRVRRTLMHLMRRKCSDGKFYAAWATAWGPMGAAAGEAGICRIILPHYQMDEMLELLAWEHPAAVPDEQPFARLIELSRAYFRGEAVEFDEVVCDIPPEASFGGQVARAARQIPYGQTISYSGLARKIGRPDAARAVATAMSKNDLPLLVPCHRVVYADGRPGGFSAPAGVDQKLRMLELERSTLDR